MNRIALCAAVMTLLIGGLALASETPVQTKDLPAAVRNTVEEQSKGATIRGLSKEIEEGKIYYEVELKVDGHSKDVSIDATGAVVEVEEEIALDALPVAVRAVIEKQAGKSRIVVIESLTKNGSLVEYEAKIQRGSKAVEVSVAPDGTIMK